MGSAGGVPGFNNSPSLLPIALTKAPSKVSSRSNITFQVGFAMRFLPRELQRLHVFDDGTDLFIGPLAAIGMPGIRVSA